MKVIEKSVRNVQIVINVYMKVVQQEKSHPNKQE